MKRQTITFLLLLMICANVFAQRTKIRFEPSDDVVATVNGDWENFLPVKIKGRNPNEFVVAYHEGYVTEGFIAKEMFDKIGDDKSDHTIQLEKINKLPEDANTRKIEITKMVNATEKLQGGVYSTGFYAASNPNIDINSSKYIKPMVEHMEKWGYNVGGSNTVFKERGNPPSLAIAGELMRIGKDTKGPGFQVSMLVDWSVLDVKKEEVVLELRTAGFSDTRNGWEFSKELPLAFKNALTGLLSNEKFQDIAIKKESTKKTKEGVLQIDSVASKDYPSRGKMIDQLKKSVVTIKTEAGHGSGFVISEDGHILTNEHVVGGRDDIKIKLSNGLTIQGKVTRTSEERDVAIVKMEAGGLEPLSINTGAKINTGDDVMAIGTPADIKLGQTVTKGIISGKRELDGQNYIQTDVSINPGSSGGPLVSKEGNVIGIVVSKRTEMEGIGFAIPIDEGFNKLNVQLQ